MSAIQVSMPKGFVQTGKNTYVKGDLRISRVDAFCDKHFEDVLRWDLYDSLKQDSTIIVAPGFSIAEAAEELNRLLDMVGISTRHEVEGLATDHLENRGGIYLSCWTATYQCSGEELSMLRAFLSIHCQYAYQQSNIVEAQMRRLMMSRKHDLPTEEYFQFLPKGKGPAALWTVEEPLPHDDELFILWRRGSTFVMPSRSLRSRKLWGMCLTYEILISLRVGDLVLTADSTLYRRRGNLVVLVYRVTEIITYDWDEQPYGWIRTQLEEVSLSHLPTDIAVKL